MHKEDGVKSSVAKDEAILKRAQKGDAALEAPEMPREAKKIATVIKAKEGLKHVKQGIMSKEVQECTVVPRAPDKAEEAAIAEAKERVRAKFLAFVDAENAKNSAAAKAREKEEISEDAQTADKRIQDLCKQLEGLVS